MRLLGFVIFSFRSPFLLHLRNHLILSELELLNQLLRLLSQLLEERLLPRELPLQKLLLKMMQF